METMRGLEHSPGLHCQGISMLNHGVGMLGYGSGGKPRAVDVQLVTHLA